jgi:hypothetical protein
MDREGGGGIQSAGVDGANSLLRHGRIEKYLWRQGTQR